MLTTFFQRSTTSLNQISSFGKKLLSTYAYMTNAVKSSYSFHTSLESTNTEQKNPGVELLQLTPKLESFLNYAYVRKLGESCKSILAYTILPDGELHSLNFKEKLIAIDQRSFYNETGVDYNSESTVEEPFRYKYIIKGNNNAKSSQTVSRSESTYKKAIIDPAKNGKLISTDIEKSANIERLEAHQTKLISTILPNGQCVDHIEENSKPPINEESHTMYITNNFEVEGIGEVAVTGL